MIMKTTLTMTAALAFTLFSALPLTLHAGGPCKSTGHAGATTPMTQAESSPRPGCRTTANGRTNCNAWAGATVNPNYSYNQYRPGYVSGADVVKGMKPKPWKRLPPGERLNRLDVPHLGAVPAAGGPAHTFAIFPDGSVGQRFDTDPGRYQRHFNNMNDFRRQRPGWRQDAPYERTVFEIYCPPNCRQH